MAPVGRHALYHFVVHMFMSLCLDIDECMSSPCVYGRCNDLISAFQCVCQIGYDGILCNNSELQRMSCN